MKPFEWNQEKNEILKKTRGISFEEIVAIIKNSKQLKVINNTKKYPKQRVFIVNINKYIYCVPFVEDSYKIFLKTIFPSSKLTKILVKEQYEKTKIR